MFVHRLMLMKIHTNHIQLTVVHCESSLIQLYMIIVSITYIYDMNEIVLFPY